MLPMVTVGPWHFSSYLLVHVVAFAVAGTLAIRRGLHSGYPARWVAEVVVLVPLAAIGGAVLFFGAVAAAAGASTPLLRSGSSIFGVIAAGGAAGYAYARLRGVSPGTGFDVAIVFLPLGQAIGRLGCLLAGCCYGKATDSWLALTLPDEHGVWQPRYPTQLLAAGGDFLIFLALLAFERARRRRGGEWPFAGAVTILYGGLYATKRFLLEFLRDDPPFIWPPFTWAHAAAAALLLVAAGLGAWRWKAAPRDPQVVRA